MIQVFIFCIEGTYSFEQGYMVIEDGKVRSNKSVRQRHFRKLTTN
jgi:hypothetical protein